ncbi:uncharacterized protein LOC127859481 isoform X4 [Dreissena polymorpha]|uniref:uncharacterized protein LOC127859481 isoform X2 n=1 Tax=Dreissena polymorpha TaxID=45954 RepID=UPI0022655853|nr:uncharacterized protein LOC127859481 isoform X2 [Dreissena polymorpha]XP_052252892.1 uncharacterized protein LOC127859481 isoform X3 [Dreissena polymorpha]XP_052252893.1 uncharacterized protein LOC127859481 isoform X4 [Dreissena polymorpha]
MELIFKWLLVVLAIKQVCTASAPTPPDNKGTEFILMFMENVATADKQFDLELYCTTQQTTPVTVHVTTPLWNNPRVDETFTVIDGNVTKIIISASLRMTGSGVDTKGIHVSADAEVACYGANKETTSNDVYLGLPVDALGMDYYTVSHSPPENMAEIGIAGTEDGTTVSITLPAGHGPLSVTFQGKTYHEGETISVTLDRFKTLQLQSKGDLTGTHIVTSKPVAVFSGNIKTNVGTGTFSDHLVEQMVPADRWGKEFVTAPIPGRTVGDVFRVVAKANGTVVSITGRPPITLNAGESREFEIPSDQYAHITSTEPVMIAQFVKSQLTSAEPADPSMILVPPLEQFGSDYTFTTPEYSRPDYGNASIYRYQNEFMIVAKKSDIGGLLLDGKPFPQSTWKDIPGTNLVGTYLTLPHGPHTVRHSDPLSTFGGYLYGHAYRESYGFPTGMRTALIYSSNCKPTPTVPGDGIDNDCDNKIDEELCTPDNNMNDDDGDGRQDEDCVKTTPIDGFWGTWAAWSTSCSVTCGDGVVTRKRKCDAPVPKFGGKNCTGLDFENKACYSGQLCSLDAANFCASNAKGIAPNPLNCAQYIDCSRNGPYNQTHLFECPYPDLFNANTLQCDNFENVHCDKRMEPMDPCDYLQNQCNGSDPNCKPCRDRWPSCVAKDDGRQAVSVFAPEYADCKKNRTMSQGKCDIGFFDSRSHQCVPHNPGSLQFYCRVHPTAKIPEPHNCAKYYDCTKKGRTLQDFTSECQYPDLFSMTTNQCENFSQVACTPRTEPQAPCEYDQNHCPPTNTTCSCPDNHADCRGQLDGTQSWPGKLWGPDFVDCLTNRTMKQQRCSPGLYFNPVLKKCIDSVKPGEVTDVCSANPTLVLQDSQNCAKYINCSLATSLLGNHMQECTYPDLFSMTTKSCDKFEKVNCDQRPEPMAPCDYDQNKCAPGNATCHCPDNLPSCVGLADGNQSYPSRIWKPDYVVCYKNRTILPTHKCTKGYFHPVLKQCTENIAKTDAVPYCKANPTGIIPVPDSCAQYINCSRVASGLANADPVSECIYPDLFSMASMSCQDFTTVQCDKRPEPMAPCEYKQFNCSLLDPKCVPCPDRLPSCVGLVDGNQSYPSRMWKPDYVDCYKNRTTLPVKRCTKGYFHPVLKQCTEIVNKTDAKPYCTANPNDVIAMPDDCAQYIDCTVIIGNPTAEPVKECPYPDLFSTLSMVCQDFTTVQCDKRPEPMAPCEYEKLRCAPGNSTCNCPATLPSCVGLTNGNQPFPSRMWKPDFVICNKNRTNLPTEKCTKGYFHPTLKRCTEDITKPDATPYCQANPTAIVPLSDNCAQYINCSVVAMGTIADPVQECTYPDLFSKVTLMCVNFTTLPSCDGRREPMAPCEYKQNLCSPLQTPGCTPCPSRLPSCVGVPDGDQPFPGQLWADNFVHCYRNRTLGVDKCPAGSVFDPNTRQCTSSINSKNIDSFCQANPTAVKTNPSNCAQFFNCSDLSSRYGHFLEECTYPMLFSNTTLTCERFESVNCKNRSEPQAPCEYLQNLCNPSDPNCVRCPDRLPSCVGLADGNQPFPNRMWKPDYVVCNKNRTNLPTQKCTKGYFHPVLKQCTEDVNKTDAKDYCHANPTSVLPMANNCAKYINCSAFLVGDVPDPVVECMYPDLFSTATLRCEKFESVVCNKRKEPQAPCEYDANQCDPGNPQCVPCATRLPSCVGLADGTRVFPGREWKPDHITCYKNRTVLPTDRCADGFFHPVKEQCTKDIDKVDALPYCQANPHDMIPMRNNCAQYIDCPHVLSANPTDPVGECTYPDLYSTVSRACQRFTTVTCGTRPEPMAPCEYEQNLCPPNNASCEHCPLRLPSCIGLSDGAQPFPTRLWLADYIQCYRNRTVAITKCRQGTIFDPIQQACVSDVPRDKMESYCQANPTAIKKDPDHCAQYFNCSETNTTLGHHLMECKYPDLFSDTTLRCESFETVLCATRNEPKAPCEYSQNQCNHGNTSCAPCQDRLPSCVGLPDGAQPFPSKLWSAQYVVCYKERTTELKQCPNNGFFNPTSKKCDNTVQRPDAKPYCQSHPAAVVTLHDNCAQYINCSAYMAGSLADPVVECTYPKLFDDNTLTCRDFQSVTCGARPEPKAPCYYQQYQKPCAPADSNCIPCDNTYPSCVGLADGNQPFPSRMWKPDYVVCNKNRTSLPTQKCTKGYFHPVLKQCTEDVNTTDAVPYCQANPRDMLPMATNCGKYYNCTATLVGGSVVQECPYPYLFSTLSMVCQDFTTVQCDKRPEPMAPCEYDQNQCSLSDPSCSPCPDRLPSCVGLPNGEEPAQAHLWTDMYVRCYRNRTLEVEHCPSGAVYNPDKLACVTKITSGDVSLYCQANHNAIKPHETNCAQYYNCSNPSSRFGNYIEECHYPDLFSTVSMSCAPYLTVPCGTRMEPQAPCDYLQNRCNGSEPGCVPCDQRLPSCLGLPDGKNAVAGKEWQPTYVKCKDNRTVSMEQCSTKYFHPITKKCTDQLDRGDVKDYCQKNPTAILAAEDNCALYFNCSDPHSMLGPYIGECTYPNLFSRFTMTCGSFRNTLCDSRPEPQAPCQYERNLCPKSDLQCLPCPERLPSCVGRHDGPQPDTTHLWGNKYIECFMNRTMTTRTCHPGEYFHPRLRQCRSYVDPVDIPEYCKMHATEVVTSPDNCAVYYNCSDSRSAFKAECPYPDLFDSTAMRCSSFEQIQCGNRPEPMAPCQYDQNQCKPSDLACKPCVDRFPSCVGHADGNWPVTSSSWGPDYVKCYKNRTLGVEHCKTGFFHPVQRTCTSDIGKNDLSYYCDAHPSAVIGNPDNCAQYVNCSLVTATTIPMQECTYPDLFAADTRTCSRFTTVTCGTRMEPQAPCEYDQNKCAPGDSSCTPCPERLPSCIGIQDGAQPFTGREWTQQYMECFRNRTVALNTCPPGSVFEPYQSSCVSRIDKNVIQSYCQFNPGALKEHADNCAQYYDCSQPASPLGPFLMECPYPQLFSALSSACVPYQQAQCGRKTEPKAPCDYIKNLCSPTDPNCIPCSSRLPSCDGLSNGPQPYPGRLWQTDYVSCRDNRTIAMETCPRGFFSPLQRSCVDSVTKTTIVDYCKAHPEDIMTDPSNCARFFNCSDPASPLGPYQEECSYPGLFSVQLKSCMPFDTVDCLNRHEPKAPCDYASNQCSPQDSQCVPCAQRHPSCEGLPDGDNLLQSSLWKGQYIRCMGNRTLSTERCGQGYFNPHTRFCQTDVDPVDIVPYCKANPQAIVAKGDNCAQYFLCSKVVGTMATVEECPYPDLFSRSTLRCERFESVDCDRRPEPQAPCQYSQNQCAPNDPTCAPCASRLPSCVREQDGFHPVGGQAWGSGYVECRKNRTISVSQCPQGSYFSPTDHRCTQNINTGDIDSFCRAHPTHIRLHPTNCAQYYDCAATALGGQILRECPYPQLFDPATLTCKPFTNVSCGIRFEPTAPCEYMSNQCSPSQTGCVPCNQRQPSCNGLADGYHAFPGLLWQQQYIICYKNRTTSVTQCTGVQLFNPTSRKCVDVKDLTKAEIQSYCQSHPTSVLADPTDCSRYFQCSAIGLSSGGHLQCTYPDLFSPTSGRCVDFSLVDCGTRKEPTRPCEYDHNQCPTSDPACVPCPTRLPDCQGRPDGDNGIPGMLWSLNYVRCQGNRTVEVKRCTQGVFDPNIRACSSNIGPSHINDLCFSNPKAIVPHPTNCAQYFDCSKASTPFGHFLMECPYPDLFDERTLTCKPFTQVQCGNKAEPKAPCEYFQNLCPAGNLTCTPCGQRLPSCVGLPDGSRSLPSQSWSPQFMTCSLGRTLALHQCPSGVFDPTRMVCSTSVQPVDIPKYCQANPQAVLPDPSSCSKYFNCSKPETGYQQECLYPMLFSVEFSSCDTFRNVQCGTRPEPQTPCEYTQNQCSLGDLSCVPCPQRLPSCRGLPDGINGAPGHLWTDMYIQCLQNRTMVVQHCRHGFFNPLQKQCVENVDPNQVNQVCQANPSAIFSDPTNCAKYYDCRQTLGFGSSYLKECSYPDLFSVSLKSCQNFTTVDCENRTEPQAPCEYDQNQCASMFNCRPCSERLASCVGLPDGENAYPGRRWTADHVYCLGNRTLTSGRCSSPSIFDPIARKCTPNVDPSHAPDYCQTNPQAMFPSTRSAAQYFDCSQPQSPLGTPYLQECTYPDLFHASNLRCQGFTSVPTDQRPTPQAPCEYEKNHCQTWDVGCVPCPQRLHSCVGLPDGLNPIEGKQWSPEYVNCHLNRTVGSGRCSQGVFDPNSRQCASTTQPGPLSIPDQCRQNPSLLIPDSRSCALYYNCSKIVGTLSPLLPAQLEECDYPKLYSTQYGRCLDFQSVQCNDRNEVMAPCQYLQNQCNSADATCQSCMERLPSCIGLPDGNNPIPGRYWTREYIHCYKNRTLAKESCQTGFFNPDTRQCSDDVSKGNIDDYCKNHPNAKVANADNCAQFYECTKTLPRIAAPVTDGLSLVIRQECHYPDLFSTITQRCEPFTKVNCDKRPEPQAPCEYTQNQCAPGDATCEPCQDRLPSCVGLGEGDRGVPGREYTSLYVSCHLNRTLDVKHCQQGFFDAGLHMCVTQINSGMYL